jgi:hypothetical protein
MNKADDFKGDKNYKKNYKNTNFKFNIIRQKPKNKRFELKSQVNVSIKRCVEEAIVEAQTICLDKTKKPYECISAWDKVEELSKAAADLNNKKISICDFDTFLFDVDPLCIDFLD